MSDQDYLLGHVGQLEDDAKLFLERAGKLFTKGFDDKEAFWFRDLAKEWEKRAIKKREEYEAAKASQPTGEGTQGEQQQ